MPPIKSLTAKNFVITGNAQKTLCINVDGAFLVFFKMMGCENCKAFEPVFVNLSKQESRVMLAVVDLTSNKDIVQWSRQTSTPINAVPVLILYINGRPHAKFNGTKNIVSIQNFISKALEAATNTAPPAQFVSSQQPTAAMAAAPPLLAPSGGGGRNMYGGAAPPSNKTYMPDLGTLPSLKGVVKGTPHGFVEDEDEPHLITPDSVTPYNRPWEAEYGVGM